MAKKHILVAYQIPKEGLYALSKDFEFIYPENLKFTQDEIIALSKDVDVILSVFGNKIPDEALLNRPRLKMISNFGAGFDNINIDLATANNILVTNTPDPVTEPTAELTLGLALSLMRNIASLDRKLKQTQEVKWGVMENLGNSLNHKTVGIVGLGKIGFSAAKKFQAFGATICYYKRHRLDEKMESENNFIYKSFKELIQVSDVISLHTPLNEETRHLFHAPVFAQMKPTAYVINTARGPVINENDLVHALQQKHIAGAALDVFEFEPEISKSLLHMENVVVVPHIGTATIDTRLEIARDAAKNIIDFFAGNLQKNIINPEIMKS